MPWNHADCRVKPQPSLAGLNCSSIPPATEVAGYFHASFGLRFNRPTKTDVTLLVMLYVMLTSSYVP